MAERKTHEQFINELKEVNPNVECLTFYVNNHTKVKLRCLICGHEWLITPKNALHGRNCPVCADKNRIKHHTTSLETMLIKLKEKWNGLIVYVSGYKNYNTKCLFHCTVDGYEWENSPHNILYGEGCPICSKKRVAEKRSVSLEKFLKRLKDIWGDSVEYISGYKNMTTKCFFRCTIHNHIWETTPSNLVNNKHGCPVCGIEHIKEKQRMPLEEVLDLIKIIFNDTIEYVGGYANTQTSCIWRCKVCGREWRSNPNNLMRGHGCKNCAAKRNGENRIPPIEKVIERVEKKHDHKIEYVSGYIDCSTLCLWRCRECGHEWYLSPSKIMFGSGCSVCKAHSMEKPVAEALRKKKVKFIHNKKLEGCVYKRYCLRPDFRIEENGIKLVIECDGKQHNCPIHGEEALRDQQAKDRCKDKFLKEHGYILIRVTSSLKKEWGTERHITLPELMKLIEEGIDENGNINIEVFRPYDFNRE